MPPSEPSQRFKPGTTAFRQLLIDRTNITYLTAADVPSWLRHTTALASKFSRTEFDDCRITNNLFVSAKVHSLCNDLSEEVRKLEALRMRGKVVEKDWEELFHNWNTDLMEEVELYEQDQRRNKGSRADLGSRSRVKPILQTLATSDMTRQLFFSKEGSYICKNVTNETGYKPDITLGFNAENFMGREKSFWLENFKLAFPYRKLENGTNVMFPYLVHEVKTAQRSEDEAVDQILRLLPQLLNCLVASLPNNENDESDDPVRSVFGLSTQGVQWTLYVFYIQLRPDIDISDSESIDEDYFEGSQRFRKYNSRDYGRYFQEIASGRLTPTQHDANLEYFTWVMQEFHRYIHSDFEPTVKRLCSKALEMRSGDVESQASECGSESDLLSLAPDDEQVVWRQTMRSQESQLTLVKENEFDDMFQHLPAITWIGDETDDEGEQSAGWGRDRSTRRLTNSLQSNQLSTPPSSRNPVTPPASLPTPDTITALNAYQGVFQQPPPAFRLEQLPGQMEQIPQPYISRVQTLDSLMSESLVISPRSPARRRNSEADTTSEPEIEIPTPSSRRTTRTMRTPIRGQSGNSRVVILDSSPPVQPHQAVSRHGIIVSLSYINIIQQERPRSNHLLDLFDYFDAIETPERSSYVRFLHKTLLASISVYDDRSPPFLSSHGGDEHIDMVVGRFQRIRRSEGLEDIDLCLVMWQDDMAMSRREKSSFERTHQYKCKADSQEPNEPGFLDSGIVKVNWYPSWEPRKRISMLYLEAFQMGLSQNDTFDVEFSEA
ncbi:hypothetical protein ABW19_dt0203612 [Dactylella cylindrospora]|nr:hypothetical protein ABW19_dt0203612 [Dactylella cylindrospora]